MRRQVRNYMAHGAFGNDSEAFDFHPSAGAVPIKLPHLISAGSFSIGRSLDFDAAEAFKLLIDFVEFLKTDQRYGPLFKYAQESYLPTILTMASDGTYKAATESFDEMEQFIDVLCREMDDATNMDW